MSHAAARAAPTPGVRALQLARLFPGIEEIKVAVGAIDPDTGHPNHVDMLYVAAIATHIGARRLFEFGTYLGRTTRRLAEAHPEAQVYTLDLDPAGPRPGKMGPAVRAVLDRGLQGFFYKTSPQAGRITQLHGDSRAFEVGALAKTMDFVFVDAAHEYEFVKNDTDLACALVRPGGVIVWHDYAEKTPGVMQALDALGEAVALFHIEKTSLVVFVDGLDPATIDWTPHPYSRAALKG